MKSERTKQCKRLSILFLVLHILCLFGPLLYFIPYAYIVGEVGRKLALSLFLIVALCLSVVAIISDAKTRGGFAKSIMWILVIGISICLQEVKVFVYIMAIVSIIDELVIVKLRAKYKNAYASNKEIDRRM